MLRSTSGPTALRGRAAVAVHQEAASLRSSAATGSGTVQRQGRTRRGAAAAARTSLPVEWRGRGRCHRTTSLAGRCVTPSARDATTSCTVLTAATRGTAPCASRGLFTATATGGFMSEFETKSPLTLLDQRGKLC